MEKWKRRAFPEKMCEHKSFQQGACSQRHSTALLSLLAFILGSLLTFLLISAVRHGGGYFFTALNANGVHGSMPISSAMPFVDSDTRKSFPLSSSTSGTSVDASSCVAVVAGSQHRMHIVPAKITTQSSQDGVISSIFAAIGTTNRFYAEFGFNSDDWVSGSGANTYQLHLGGWTGVLLDGSHENATMNLHKHWLEPDGIASLFVRYEVPRELDYLSVDIDSVDLWMLRGLFVAGFRPRLISIEYNMNYAFRACVTQGWWVTRNWAGNRIFGTSLRAVASLAEEFGYAVVAVVRGNDAFLVPCDVLAAHGFAAPALDEFEADTCANAHEEVPGDQRADALSDIMDFCAWRKTGVRASAVAAAEDEVLHKRPAQCPVIIQ